MFAMWVPQTLTTECHTTCCWYDLLVTELSIDWQYFHNPNTVSTCLWIDSEFPPICYCWFSVSCFFVDFYAAGSRSPLKLPRRKQRARIGLMAHLARAVYNRTIIGRLHELMMESDDDAAAPFPS